MLVVSQAIRNAMTAPIKRVGARFVVHRLGQTDLEFASDGTLSSVNLEQEGNYCLSAVRSGKVKVTGSHYGILAGLSAELYVKIKTGVDNLGNPVWEEIDYGTYYIKEEEVNLERDMTTYSIIDPIGLMRERIYTRGTLAYPDTVAGLIEQVASLFGLTLKNSVASLPNADIVIPSATEDQLELFEESAQTTLRDVLDQLAGATGCVARIALGSANTLELRPLDFTVQDSMDYANLISIKVGELFGTVNTLTLATEPQEDNIIYPEGITDRVEFRLTNNEVVSYADDDADTKRIAMATALYGVFDGWEYRGCEAKTEGHGWYEVGDRLTITDDSVSESFETVITSIKITIDGGFSETIKSEVPEQEQTDYSTAGSTTKTVWTVSLKTDKQQGEIRGLVEKTDTTNEVVNANYTEFLQTVNQISQTVQTAGGTNLIKNSVGFDKDNGNFPNWTSTGTVASQTSPESRNYGAISGGQFDLSASSNLIQRVSVAIGQPYTLSARVKKPTVGRCRIVVYNDNDSFLIDLPDSTEYIWNQVSLEGIIPTQNYFDVKIENIGAEHLYITDLMLSQSDSITPWQQSSSEILNTQVALTDNGIKVKSNTSGDYVQITPLEFAGYSDISGSEQKVFYLNRDTTKVAKIAVRDSIVMPPLKIVPITSGNRAGWAFVKTEETW